MRILLVSDIHANWSALRAIREDVDLSLCLGDLVEYGVEPGPCIAWARQHCAEAVRGNHDHGAAHDVPVNPTNGHGFKYLTAATRPLGRQLLSRDDRRYLASLPLTRYRRIDGRRLLLVHATPRDPLDEFAPPDPELWARRLDGVDADVICVGHTHQAFSLKVGNKLVVNPGAVGLQRDGDPRAAYAILDGDRVTLHRLQYPIDEAIQAVEASPLPAHVKQMLTAVYREGRLAPVSAAGTNGRHGPAPSTTKQGQP